MPAGIPDIGALQAKAMEAAQKAMDEASAKQAEAQAALESATLKNKRYLLGCDNSVFMCLVICVSEVGWLARTYGPERPGAVPRNAWARSPPPPPRGHQPKCSLW